VNGHGNGAKLVLQGLATAAALALVLSGCSEVGYPAIHDMPAPRAEAPLTPDQVKQATDDLISQREHLSTEAQGSAQPSPAPAAQSAAAQPTITGTTPAPSAYAKP
jgi:hypothetical protein